MTKRLGVVGGGGLGPTLFCHVADFAGDEAIGFYDDAAVARKVSKVAGVPIFGTLGDIRADYKNCRFDQILLAIGYRHLAFRAAFFDDMGSAGVPFASLVHPS